MSKSSAYYRALLLLQQQGHQESEPAPTPDKSTKSATKKS